MDGQIAVSDDMLDALNATRPWVKFLAILGFVVIAFMVLAGLVMFVGFSVAPATSKLPSFVGPALGILYLVLAVFCYLIPCLYLMRYANAITRIQVTGQAALEDALKQQKSFWKYVGIFTIVMLATYVLLVIGMIAFAVIYGSIHHP